MMRCKACNSVLNDYESTRKSALTGEYLDLCNPCFSCIEDEVPVIVRSDLMSDTMETEFDE